MIKKTRWLAGISAVALAASLAVTGPPAVAAERPDSLGKDYWVAFLQNYNGDQSTQLSLFISGATATTGTVSAPGVSWSENFSVTPGTVTTVKVPVEVMLSLGDSGNPEAKAVHVTAGEEVSVYGLNRLQYTTDAFAALPADVLGKEHIVLAYPSQFQASEFAVVASQDGTDVTYVPTAATTSGVNAGQSKTVTLNQGQALPVSSNAGDLSGTTISSTKPVAVFGGQQCADVPDTGTQYCDHLEEQLPGTGTWGKNFLTVPLKTRLKGDTFRMIASEDNTAVSVNGSVVATLAKGAVHQQIIDGQSTISADKPILVAQYSNGTTYDGVTSDPFMMLTTPNEQFLSQYTFATPATGFAKNFVNVVAPTSSIGDVKLDGAPVPAGEFTQIGSTDYSGAKLDLTLGSHSMSSSKPFGIYVYGFDTDDSYGYPGGAAYAAINEVAALTLTPATQQVNVNTQACVTATVTDKGGAGLPGIELALDVKGVNTASQNVITDAQGAYQYCYTSTATGTDTVTATFGKSTLTASATVTWVTAKPKPPKRKKLPINAKGVKGKKASFGSDGRVVLVKSLKTNSKGKLSVRAVCVPVKSSVAGEVRFCDTSVSKTGKVTVRSTGYGAVRVVVTARAVPKKGQRDTWKPNRWRYSWRVTS